MLLLFRGESFTVTQGLTRTGEVKGDKGLLVICGDGGRGKEIEFESSFLELFSAGEETLFSETGEFNCMERLSAVDVHGKGTKDKETASSAFGEQGTEEEVSIFFLYAEGGGRVNMGGLGVLVALALQLATLDGKLWI